MAGVDSYPPRRGRPRKDTGRQEPIPFQPLSPGLAATVDDARQAAFLPPEQQAGSDGETTMERTAGLPIPEAWDDSQQSPEALDFATRLRGAEAPPVNLSAVREDVPLPTPELASAQETPQSYSETAEPIGRVGWGWWTVIDEMDVSIREIDSALGFNSLIIKNDMSPIESQEFIRAIGNALSFLYMREGRLAGQVHAYKESYEASLNAVKANLDLPKTATESAKEGAALNDPKFGPTLRETKKLLISSQAQMKALDGIVAAYAITWKTVSRNISGDNAEMNMNARP